MAMSDTPKKVDQSPEKMQRIAAMLKCFEGRRNYPANDNAFAATCRAIADIVYDKPNGYLWDKTNEDGTPRINEYIGPIDNDLDWLQEKAMAEFTFCPTPKHLRALYCQNFKAADGRNININLEDL